MKIVLRVVNENITYHYQQLYNYAVNGIIALNAELQYYCKNDLVSKEPAPNRTAPKHELCQNERR